MHDHRLARHVSVGFLGTAQIDRFANLNTTLIGDYRAPKVRLPGGGGAPEIATNAKEVFVTVTHSKRTFVKDVDFITTLGFGRDGKARDNVPNIGQGPTVVITDLCILKPDPDTKELVVTSLHPNITREAVIEATGWDIRFSSQLATTPVPSAYELNVLRDLKARTNAHHASAQASQQ